MQHSSNSKSSNELKWFTKQTSRSLRTNSQSLTEDSEFFDQLHKEWQTDYIMKIISEIVDDLLEYVDYEIIPIFNKNDHTMADDLYELVGS